MASPTKEISIEEVAKHASEDSLWTIINGDVWDLTSFADMHPGGKAVLLAKDIAGRDSTEVFFGLHRSSILDRYKRYRIGRLVSSNENAKPKTYILPSPGELSLVPFAEPLWLTKGYKSPYFNKSHYRLQERVRYFFDTYVKEEALDHEKSAERPTPELMKLMGSPEWELHAMRMGPGRHLHGKVLPGGVKGEEFNYFHELVVVQELVRIGAPGYMAGLNAGMVIGLPPVLNFGTPELKAKVLPDILKGEKFISLAISEAMAGSDVRGMKTWARKTPDGKHYIVTGSKKWITNGLFSDWFMTGCRTSEDALSMILIPRTEEVETTPIRTSYSLAAGTAFVKFEGVKVPVEYCLGGENNGLKVILSNFVHERWVICCRIARYSRLIVEECFKWAHLRKVFGKRLIDQPAIRQKFAHMFAKVEAGQSWLETITHQMCNMNYAQQSEFLAGPMAGLKHFLSRAGGEIADEAVQIFGGRGITATGMGVYIEQFQRTYKFDSVLGGSEEVLADLFVRQAMKKMPRAVL
ncbi:acyl-CoA dehydrogenase NM domain-like protein [Atractiella rhizophila]|nr:acyl-CoA dehydrogenase NM domain-like protein [Atractiella rhizophila]